MTLWGVEATGPKRTAVFSYTIGTRKHADKELIGWQKRTKKLTFNVVKLEKGQIFTESIQWGHIPPMLIRRTHGFQDVGYIKADKRVCEE